jgi:hypothetical protein
MVCLYSHNSIHCIFKFDLTEGSEGTNCESLLAKIEDIKLASWIIKLTYAQENLTT